MDTTTEVDPGHAALREAIRNLRSSWDAVGIDLRGITGAMRAYSPSVALAGYITSPGSRKRCDEALQKFGRDGTLEALVLRPEFADLFNDRAREHARRRLDGEPEGDITH